MRGFCFVTGPVGTITPPKSDVRVSRRRAQAILELQLVMLKNWIPYVHILIAALTIDGVRQSIGCGLRSRADISRMSHLGLVAANALHLKMLMHIACLLWSPRKVLLVLFEDPMEQDPATSRHSQHLVPALAIGQHDLSLSDCRNGGPSPSFASPRSFPHS
jgi:hypothetical protein